MAAGIAAALVGVATAALLGWLLQPVLGGWAIYVVACVAIAVVAVAAGGWPGVLATMLSAVIIEAWLRPEHPLGDRGVLGAIALFVVSGLLISLLAEWGRRSKRRASLLLEKEVAERTREARENEERLRLALDAAEAGTWSWDVASNRSTWDERYHALYGFESNNPVSFETWITSVHPDDRQQLLDRIQSLLRPGEGYWWREEFRAIHPQKGERWMAGIGRIYRDPAGNAVRFAGINLDVTARRHAEVELQRLNEELEQRVTERTEQLREQQARLQAILDNAFSAIITFDQQGIIQSVNSAAERMFGYGAGELDGQHVAIMLPLRDQDEKTACLNQFLTIGPADNQGIRQELAVGRKDGSVFHVDLAVSQVPRLRLFTAILNDISERKVAEDERIRSLNLLQAVIEGTTDAIYVKDLAGRYLMMNSAAARIVGKSPQDVIGMDDTSLFTADSAQRLIADDRLVMDTDVTTIVEDTTTVAGETHIFSSTKGPYRDAQGRVIGSIGVSRDITARKHAEEELERRLAELTILNQVAVICAAATTEDELLGETTRLVADKLFGDNCGFLLLDAGRGVLAPHDSFVITDPSVVRESIPLDVGITGQVARTGKSMRVGDVTKEAAYLPSDSRTRSEMCLPIKVGARVVGVLNIEKTRPDGFTQTDEQLMNTIVDLVGNALERLRAENQLKRRERELADFIEYAAVGMCWVQEDGVIQWANRAELELLGYSREEYVGQPLENFHVDASAAVELLRRFRARESLSNYEVTLRCRNGTYRWALVNASPYIEDGQFIHTRCFTRDITKRKELEREVVEIATLEQQRIGQDLHDDCGQELTALGLLADSLIESLREAPPHDVALARKIGDGLRRVLRQVRSISRGLARAEVEPDGLAAALSELVVRLGETPGVRCVFEGDDTATVKDRITATHLYHIAQEACTNALKHAEAKRLAVRLGLKHRVLWLEIEDDGMGMPADAPPGLGQRIMNNRASLIGACLMIESAKPQGTLVRCILSKESGHAASE